MTTCRTPASAARPKYSSKNLVRAPWKVTKFSPKSAVFSWWSGSLPSRTSAYAPPTARQKTSAYGSTASGSGFCASNARAVATNNAVAPTLVVMSQVSPSLRTQTTVRRVTDTPFPMARNGTGGEVGKCRHPRTLPLDAAQTGGSRSGRRPSPAVIPVGRRFVVSVRIGVGVGRGVDAGDRGRLQGGDRRRIRLPRCGDDLTLDAKPGVVR